MVPYMRTTSRSSVRGIDLELLVGVARIKVPVEYKGLSVSAF